MFEQGMHKVDINYLTDIRHHLHRYPELSGEEYKTAEFIASELKKTDPDRILEKVGGTGVVAVYGDDDKGPQILFRAELDALKIPEKGNRDYKSTREGISHACGHDGHMSVMLGVGRYLKDQRPERGRVIILFQPAEETGEGARKVLDDPKFQSLKIDRSYAFHNLPGFEKGRLFYRPGSFASASVGLRCNLEGESSHAAYPEQGRNPSVAVADLAKLAQTFGNSDITDPDYAIATVTYIRLGEKAFGISPGHAEVGLTLRAARDSEIEWMKMQIRTELKKSAEMVGLEWQIHEREPFTATVNSEYCIGVVKSAANRGSVKTEQLAHPFPWSEDFGRFAEKSEIALIGIGAGKNHPHLHAYEYDFPDEIIPEAVVIFINIMNEEWSRQKH